MAVFEIKPPLMDAMGYIDPEVQIEWIVEIQIADYRDPEYYLILKESQDETH